MADAARSIGRPIPRLDGRDKVTGAARYVDDLTLPGMWHGRTVRSAVPHAQLRAIVLDPAFDWSGVVVVTAEDITAAPGANNVIALMDTDQPALVPVGGRIKHPDEPVALIAAPDPERAAEALRHVRLEYDPLPAVFDPEEALRSEVKIYRDHNILKEIGFRKGGDVEAALAGADVVVEGTYRTGAQEQMYIEPQGMLAAWDEDAAGAPRVTVQGSMQCPYYVHTALREVLGLPSEGVVIMQAVTGGGFGGKEEYPSILAAHAALLARKAGRPVKMIYDRAEDIGATTKRHPSIIRHRMGFRRDGTLVAIDVDVLLDGGAYLTLTPVVLSRAVLHAAGPYRCDTTRVRGRAVATNTPPHGAYRGFGAPQATFAYERQMDKAARALGLDPFELRRRNMLRLDDTTATGQVLRYSVASQAVLDAVTEQLARPAPHGRPGPSGPHLRRGRGLSFYYHGAGFTGAGEERLKGKVKVAVCEDGTFEVRSASTDIGQGAITTFAQIAADTLGVPLERVRVCRARTDMVPDSGPTVASRTCMVVGSVVEKAARALRDRLESWARDAGVEGKDLVAIGAAFAERHGEAEELATYQSPPGIHFDETTYTGDAYPVFGWAACVVDLVVDLDTFEVTIERLVHAVDVGKAIHPIIVKGQIEGGTLQALGWALWEHVMYKDGRVLNRRMTDSIIPTAIEAPEMETLIIEDPYPHGPHGAKGIGEIPMDGPAAAVANALDDALDGVLGRPCDAVPLLPEVLEQLARGEAARVWV